MTSCQSTSQRMLHGRTARPSESAILLSWMALIQYTVAAAWLTSGPGSPNTITRCSGRQKFVNLPAVSEIQPTCRKAPIQQDQVDRCRWRAPGWSAVTAS